MKRNAVALGNQVGASTPTARKGLRSPNKFKLTYWQGVDFSRLLKEAERTNIDLQSTPSTFNWWSSHPSQPVTPGERKRGESQKSACEHEDRRAEAQSLQYLQNKARFPPTSDCSRNDKDHLSRVHTSSVDAKCLLRRFSDISRIAVPVKKYVKSTTDALREERDSTGQNLLSSGAREK